jgi:hypothetical protein
MPDYFNLYLAGWQQGAIVPTRLYPFLIPCHQKSIQPVGEGLAIVISQDCDINCPSVEIEPFVEVLWSLPVLSIDGNLTHGKNPRRLHFKVLKHEKTLIYETQVRWRFELPREQILENGPDRLTYLEKETSSLLSKWIAKRYIRAAFPDAFNKRYKPDKKKIRSILKDSEELLTGIYILMEDDEKPDEEDYKIVLRATMQNSVFEVSGQKEVAENCIVKVAQVMNAASGISVVDYDIVAEQEFSLTDVANFKRWDFDDLSF